MMDWFKMQTVWGASVERLSDAEAGRFIKALYAFVRDGVEYEGSSGREDPVIWQALEALRGDVESFKEKEANQKEKEEALKEKRREAALSRWMQKDAKSSKCMQKDANADNCIICNASASQNKNKDNYIKESPLTGTKEKAAALDRSFDKFWACYPRHTAKQDAKKAFLKIAPDETLLTTMLTAIQKQKQTEQWSDPRYIPHPATWLNGRRWEDEPQKPAQKPVKAVSAAQYEQRDYDESKLEEDLGVFDIFKKGAS